MPRAERGQTEPARSPVASGGRGASPRTATARLCPGWYRGAEPRRRRGAVGVIERDASLVPQRRGSPSGVAEWSRRGDETQRHRGLAPRGDGARQKAPPHQRAQPRLCPLRGWPAPQRGEGARERRAARAEGGHRLPDCRPRRQRPAQLTTPPDKGPHHLARRNPRR